MKYLMIVLLSLFVLSFSDSLNAAEPETDGVKGVDSVAIDEPDEYDSINWVDLKRKEREDDKKWYSKFKAVLFRERKKETLSGEDYTVIETIEVGEGEPSEDSSVNILKVSK